MCWTCNTHRRYEKRIHNLIRKTERNRQLGRYMGDVKMELKETGLDIMDWIQLTRIGSLAASSKHSNKCIGHMKGREFFSG